MSFLLHRLPADVISGHFNCPELVKYQLSQINFRIIFSHYQKNKITVIHGHRYLSLSFQKKNSRSQAHRLTGSHASNPRWGTSQLHKVDTHNVGQVHSGNDRENGKEGRCSSWAPRTQKTSRWTKGAKIGREGKKGGWKTTTTNLTKPETSGPSARAGTEGRKARKNCFKWNSASSGKSTNSYNRRQGQEHRRSGLNYNSCLQTRAHP